MSKQGAVNEELNAALVEREEQIRGKDVQLKKLYKMVNMYKEQITNLEIKVIDRDVTIETLQEIIQQLRKRLEEPETIVEDLGEEVKH